MNDLYLIMQINLFLIYLILNITLTSQEYVEYTMKLDITENELNILNIENNKENDPCKNWIPSLFNPILLINKNIDISENQKLDYNSQTIIPIFSTEEIFYYLYSFNFLDKYKDIILAKERYYNHFFYCYFGLLHGIGNYSILNETQIFLSQSKEEGYIDKKIFSFSPWDIKEKEISQTLYLGDSYDFKSKNKDGITSSCKVNKSDMYWGCIFNEISFNKISTKLKKENGELYKIYFSSENYDIVIPWTFKDKFNHITNNACKYKIDHDNKFLNLTCENFFNDKGEFASIELINDDMVITLEIDNIFRFSKTEDEDKNKTRIRYEDSIDFFIFPLIMFKKFHVQFDAQNYLISFSTIDKSILQLKKKEKKGSSGGLKAFLVILIILIIVALGFGIFLLLRKRKNSIEKNINKYNKFEDEENYQNMKENRVF